MPEPQSLADVIDIRLTSEVGTHAGHEAARKMFELCDNLPTPADKTVGLLIAFATTRMLLEKMKRDLPLMEQLDSALDLDAIARGMREEKP